MQSKHNCICIKQRDIQLHVWAFFWSGHHQVEVQEWVEDDGLNIKRPKHVVVCDIV
jgi:hypothetical protein